MPTYDKQAALRGAADPCITALTGEKRPRCVDDSSIQEQIDEVLDPRKTTAARQRWGIMSAVININVCAVYGGGVLIVKRKLAVNVRQPRRSHSEAEIGFATYGVTQAPFTDPRLPLF
ncbi:hypothetical protein B0H11DRAFT_1915034 [Mycena galericulata]|nr:hypothetical protein B0H11DRAFT_1915034 [Mycena galericulata]